MTTVLFGKPGKGVHLCSFIAQNIILFNEKTV